MTREDRRPIALRTALPTRTTFVSAPPPGRCDQLASPPERRADTTESGDDPVIPLPPPTGWDTRVFSVERTGVSTVEYVRTDAGFKVPTDALPDVDSTC